MWSKQLYSKYKTNKQCLLTQATYHLRSEAQHGARPKRHKNSMNMLSFPLWKCTVQKCFLCTLESWNISTKEECKRRKKNHMYCKISTF